jgi:hypothetical protein
MRISFQATSTVRTRLVLMLEWRCKGNTRRDASRRSSCIKTCAYRELLTYYELITNWVENLPSSFQETSYGNALPFGTCGKEWTWLMRRIVKRLFPYLGLQWIPKEMLLLRAWDFRDIERYYRLPCHRHGLVQFTDFSYEPKVLVLRVEETSTCCLSAFLVFGSWRWKK